MWHHVLQCLLHDIPGIKSSTKSKVQKPRKITLCLTLTLSINSDLMWWWFSLPRHPWPPHPLPPLPPSILSQTVWPLSHIQASKISTSDLCAQLTREEQKHASKANTAAKSLSSAGESHLRMCAALSQEGHRGRSKGLPKTVCRFTPVPATDVIYESHVRQRYKFIICGIRFYHSNRPQ